MTKFHTFRSLSNEWREHLASESRKRKRHQQTTWMGIILVLIALAGITIWLGLASSNKRDDIETRVKSVHSPALLCSPFERRDFYGAKQQCS